MRSAIVQVKSAPIGKKKVITKESPINPANCYGDSKLQQKIVFSCLANIAIICAPMIYDKGSKGNYTISIDFDREYT